jgi:hypothetical protein
MQGVSERLGEQEELFRRIIDNVMFRLHVAMPGIIQSFDATKQTVTVQPCITERINIDGVLSRQRLPLIVDVPIILPRSGGFSITLPISQGDECLLIFSDSCIDSWWSAGGIQDQMFRRRHDLSDAFAILAPWSQPRVLQGYSQNSIQMRNDAGTNYIELSADHVKLVFGSQSIELTTDTLNIITQKVSSFGARQTKAVGSSYTADTDGFLHGGFVDGAPNVIVRLLGYAGGVLCGTAGISMYGGLDFIPSNSFCFPVRKGETYSTTLQVISAGAYTSFLYFLPMGTS